MTKRTKKLIEVALPLEAINIASAREKSIRHGHPSTLHLWWARRPLAAARAVIFAQMVDDPSEYLDVLQSDAARVRAAKRQLVKNEAAWLQRVEAAERADIGGHAIIPPGDKPTLDGTLEEGERQRLFEIIEQLVRWENTTNEEVLKAARDEIWQSWRRTCAHNAGEPRARELYDRHVLPAFHDPFAGGGALPLEAQRLGLESYASDLNPVAVLINKAMIEIPPKFAGAPPVNPKARTDRTREGWSGAQGLADDVRFYGQWMRDRAQQRIGHLYPPVEITPALVGERPDLGPYLDQKLTVIAWLWARTVKSPNPALRDVDVPLASTWVLSSKAGKQAYVAPIIEGDSYRFTVEVGPPPDEAKAGTKLSRGANFRCLVSGIPIGGDYIKAEGVAGRMGAKLMAVVAEGKRGRVYLAPTPEMEAIAESAAPTWKPDVDMPENPRWFSPPYYGLKSFGDLFTPRQLVALTTFADLVDEARKQIECDAKDFGLRDDGVSLTNGGKGAAAHADAVAVYLGFCVDYASNYWSVIATPADGFIRGTFSRQALAMTWDFAEAPPFGNTSGNWLGGIEWIAKAMESFPEVGVGNAQQSDAANQKISIDKIVSTDPPYYDNIGYADLSDFFYVWMRRSLQPIFPELFATLSVPKAEELVATPYRHGGKENAEKFFLNGMTEAIRQLAKQTHPAFPVTIYYAFKQEETTSHDGTINTGWDTFLGAVIESGFEITGTWPMRTERGARTIGIGTNALASSIVLVCRCRPADAKTATRREFLRALELELPRALSLLQGGNIAPVDLAQAAIGPGMAVYTRYRQVTDAQGAVLSVREALSLINATLDEALAHQEGDFDADTRWALAWFEEFGFDEGEYGRAETLSKAKNTAVAALEESGIIAAARGQVRLLAPLELPAAWNPATDARVSAWEIVHHLVRALETSEVAAATLVRTLGPLAEVARELCYRLYAVCERKKRAALALSYNGLVQSWPELVSLARAQESEMAAETSVQGELAFGEDLV